MDFESTNCLHSSDVSSASAPSIGADVDHQLHAIDDYHQQTHVQSFDLKAATASATDDAANFYFGNQGDNGFGRIANEVAVKSNGDGKHGAYGDDSEPEDDGPETDVDATDEGRFEHFSHRQEHHIAVKVEPVINEMNQQNPFDLVDDIVKKEENDELDHNPFEDNRFLENVSGDVAAELADAFARNKIDFSEKKEYSFEREDYEKELDPLGDVPAELIAISKEAGVGAHADDDDDDDDDEEVLQQHGNGDIDQHGLHTITTEFVTTEQHGKWI